MANVNAPSGLVPVGHLQGQNVALVEMTIASGYAANLGKGDPVEMTGTDDNIQVSAATNENSIGVFAGVRYTDTNGNPIFSEYWASGTTTKGSADAKALVWRDPFIIFRAQLDTLAEADVGLTYDWVVGTPSATTRLSTTYAADATKHATTGSLILLKLADCRNSDGSENAFGAYAKGDFAFFKHALLSGTSGA